MFDNIETEQDALFVPKLFEKKLAFENIRNKQVTPCKRLDRGAESASGAELKCNKLFGCGRTRPVD